MLLSSLLLLSNALAFPGALVGPEGSTPMSDASVVVTSHTSSGLHLTVSIQVRGDVPRFAYILPLPESVDADDITTLDPDYLQQVELFSAPRLQAVKCADLSEVTYYPVPPGCGSFDILPEVFGSDSGPAKEALGLEGNFAEGVYSVEVVSDVFSWMADAEYVPDAATAANLQTWANAGSYFAVAYVYIGEAESGPVWLEPLQLPLTTIAWELPLSLSAANVDAHDLTLLTFGTGALEPYPHAEADLEADCMILGDLETAHEANIDAALEGEAAWVLEYSGASSECAPCARDPLEFYNLADFGVGGIVDAYVTRWRHRYGTAAPAIDVLMIPSFTDDTAQARYIVHDADLEFAYPVCGQGKSANPGSCPDLSPESLEGGCDSGGALGWVWLAILPLAFYRRRVAPLALLLVFGASEARADAPSPRLDLLFDVPVWSTDRVLPDGETSGAPYLLNPFVGGEARFAFATLKNLNVGVTGGLRGFRGRGHGDVRFSFTEPHIGFDARHGTFREGVFVIPLFRYGIQGSMGVLDSAIFKPQASFGALVHVGAGAFIGRGTRRLITELRASTVPRTDGYTVAFHDVTGFTGWTYYAGTANLSLLVGMGFQ